ncbi:MAG: iron-sulfur cluster assembly scaffold protein [Sphaerochaeta sp.]
MDYKDQIKAGWVYTDIVKDHFKNPRNIWKKDDDFQPDGEGEVGAISCGDQMKIGIKVKDGKITKLKWKTYGCASAIASTSMISEMAVGMTLKDAYEISANDITNELGSLPDNKLHCSVLGDDALRTAIDDYLFKHDMDNPYNKNALRKICKCKDITNRDVKDLHDQLGVSTLEDLQQITNYGTVCGSCKEEMAAELAKVLAEDPDYVAPEK